MITKDIFDETLNNAVLEFEKISVHEKLFVNQTKENSHERTNQLYHGRTRKRGAGHSCA